MIFVDTSFWIALQLHRDSRHAAARELFVRFGDRSLVTSNHVRGETWTWLKHRAGHSDAVRFLDRLQRTPRLRVLFVGESLEADALRWLGRHDERAYSFVDTTSFAIMRAHRIKEALAFDGDFSAAGFVELR